MKQAITDFVYQFINRRFGVTLGQASGSAAEQPLSSNKHVSNSLVQSLFWLGSAQVLGRLVRLISSIIIARLLIPEAFGQIAIILTCFELLCTPTRRITSAALIKMNDNEFTKHLANANWVNWISCTLAFVLMALLSFPLAYYHNQTELILPMLVMAASFLLLPLGMQYATLNLRANKMRIVGRATLYQTLFDGVLCASFALLGMGIWAIILAKVLVIFVWIAIHRKDNPLPEHKQYKASLAQARSLAQFGIHVGLSDTSVALRQNIDYLLIGYFLGIEALGVYFFAANASLGISLGIAQSFGTALYSHLCQHTQLCEQQVSLLDKYRSSITIIMAVTIPIILLQASLAPLYVPWVYGKAWLDAGAIPIFILLCVSGLVRPLGEAASQLLLSIGLSRLNLYCNLGLIGLLSLSVSSASHWGLEAVSAAVLIVYSLTMPSFALFAYFKASRKTSSDSAEQIQSINTG